jgi:hypothetical protein
MANVDSFRTARWVRTFNLVLQAVLFFTFFAGLNYLAHNHAWRRFDLTELRRYSLSPETLSWVQHLPSPVEIIATLPNDAENPAVRGLLGEYQHAAESNPNGRIGLKYLDVDLQRNQAVNLGVEQPNAIVLLCQGRRHVLLVDELYQHNKTKERIAFLGEQVLTAAILDVSQPEPKKIYFLAGHGELRLNDPDERRGLSKLRDQLQVRNFTLDTIDLTIERKIPDDAALVVAVAPHKTYKPAEQELLRRYLSDNAGRFILFLEPGERASELGLQELLFEDWSVIVDDDRVLDTGQEFVADDGDLLIHAYQPHPITDSLLREDLWLRFGSTRSMRPDTFHSGSSGLNTVTIAAASQTAWGEKDYLKPTAKYDEGVDIRAKRGLDVDERLGVIVASERVGTRGNLPISVRGGKLVVFGTGDLVANGRYAIAGNLNVFLNAVNWTTDRDNQLKIPSRPIERYHLSLSAGELADLYYTLVFALPGGAALLGLLVYWTRRK